MITRVRQISGFDVDDANTPLSLFSFARSELHHNDVEIEVLYCGICHTDLHIAKNLQKNWLTINYPYAPVTGSSGASYEQG